MACLFATPGPAHASLAGGWCGTETATDDTAHAFLPGQVVKVLYARPSDQPNRFANYADLIQETVRDLVERFRRETNGAKLLAVDVGTRCGPQFVDIQSVVLPRPTDMYYEKDYAEYGGPKSQAVFADLRGILGLGPFPGTTGGLNRNYLVFVDSVAPDGVGSGHSDATGDDRPGPGNQNNRGDLISWIPGTGAPEFHGSRSGSVGSTALIQRTALHELTHALGAVNTSAPHQSGFGHVSDHSLDIMYGVQGTHVITATPEEQGNGPYDFGHDDYFSPNPPAGSYLATHWNIFDSVFLCPPATCDVPGSPPVASLRVCSAQPASGDTALLDASGTTSTAPIASVHFDLDYDGAFETDTGTSLVARLRRPARVVAVRVVDKKGLPDIARALVKVASCPEPVSGRAPGSGKATVRFLRSSILINLKTGVGRVRVRCNALATDRCRISFVLRVQRSAARKRNLKAGKARGTVSGGKTRSIKVKLKRRGLTMLRRSRSRKLRARAVGSSRNNLGRAYRINKRLILKAKGRP